MHNACASYFANSSRYRMQPVGPCLWRKDLSWEFGSKQRQVQTLGTHRCPPKDREKDTIREAKAKTGQGFKALVCFFTFFFTVGSLLGKRPAASCLAYFVSKPAMDLVSEEQRSSNDLDSKLLGTSATLLVTSALLVVTRSY